MCPVFSARGSLSFHQISSSLQHQRPLSFPVIPLGITFLSRNVERSSPNECYCLRGQVKRKVKGSTSHAFLSVQRDILIYSFIYLFNMYSFFWKSEICNLVTMYISYLGGTLNKSHLYHSLDGTVPSELFLEPSNLELGKEKLLPRDSNQPLHLPDESTEAPRVEGTCPRSHS